MGRRSFLYWKPLENNSCICFVVLCTHSYHGFAILIRCVANQLLIAIYFELFEKLFSYQSVPWEHNSYNCMKQKFIKNDDFENTQKTKQSILFSFNYYIYFLWHFFSTTVSKLYRHLCTLNETGLCNTDIRPGIFRRKSSSSRSRLSVVQSSSCPTSPRQGLRSNNSASSLRNFETNLSMAGCSSTSDIVPGLQRSASSISTVGRPRSSPSGLHSYTGEYILVLCVARRIHVNLVCVGLYHLFPWNTKKRFGAIICTRLSHRFNIIPIIIPFEQGIGHLSGWCSTPNIVWFWKQRQHQHIIVSDRIESINQTYE